MDSSPEASTPKLAHRLDDWTRSSPWTPARECTSSGLSPKFAGLHISGLQSSDLLDQPDDDASTAPGDVHSATAASSLAASPSKLLASLEWGLETPPPSPAPTKARYSALMSTPELMRRLSPTASSPGIRLDTPEVARRRSDNEPCSPMPARKLKVCPSTPRTDSEIHSSDTSKTSSKSYDMLTPPRPAVKRRRVLDLEEQQSSNKAQRGSPAAH